MRGEMSGHIVLNATCVTVTLPSDAALLGNRFRLVRPLGEGGMGTVHEAVDLLSGASIALKRMRPELATDERAVARFRREGAALAAIRHPGVVEVREVGELDGILYVAMELLDGQPLRDHLSRSPQMALDALVPILCQVCDALTATHAGGVIHRDIKPSNLQVCEDGRVKVVDFGVARLAGYGRVTSSGLAVGTVRYMAPEQLTGGAVDERVDIYSLGIVMYEALAGEHPFDRTGSDDPVGAILVGRATPLSTHRPDLPPEVTRVVHRAMARVPTERFGSAEALAEALRDAARGSVPSTRVNDITAAGPLRARGAVPATTPTPRPIVEAANSALGLAPTELATPQRSAVRIKEDGKSKKKKRRPPVWLFAPMLFGLCVIPAIGSVGFVGCSGLINDAQVEVGMRNVRGAIGRSPALLEMHGPALEQLEALHREDRINVFAATAFNGRVQGAIQDDGVIDEEELDGIMSVVLDIVASNGDFSLDHYSKWRTQ